MPPPGIPCPSCGKAFFASSLKFHVAQCQKKQAEMMSELLSASDNDKVHAIVARRDFTGQEWTGQLQVSVEALTLNPIYLLD